MFWLVDWGATASNCTHVTLIYSKYCKIRCNLIYASGFVYVTVYSNSKFMLSKKVFHLNSGFFIKFVFITVSSIVIKKVERVTHWLTWTVKHFPMSETPPPLYLKLEWELLISNISLNWSYYLKQGFYKTYSILIKQQCFNHIHGYLFQLMGDPFPKMF